MNGLWKTGSFGWLAGRGALVLALALPVFAFAGKGDGGLSPDSPEHVALTAASEYLADEDFNLREDYWDGELGGNKGKAIRLQFFKGNTYHFFFAAKPSRFPKDGKLNLSVVDPDGNRVLIMESQSGIPVLTGGLKPKKTGLYLVLMSVDGGKASSTVRCAMFYGYE